MDNGFQRQKSEGSVYLKQLFSKGQNKCDFDIFKKDDIKCETVKGGEGIYESS